MVKFGVPPRTRYNDLLPYGEVIAELQDHPGEWGLVASQVTDSEQGKIVRTFRQLGNFEIVTRAAGRPGVDDSRDVWVRVNGEAPDGPTGE